MLFFTLFILSVVCGFRFSCPQKTARTRKSGLFQTANLRNGFLFINRKVSLIVSILYLLVSVIHSSGQFESGSAFTVHCCKNRKKQQERVVTPLPLWMVPVSVLRLLYAEFLLDVLWQCILVYQDVHGLVSHVGIAGVPYTVVSGGSVP